MPDILIRGMEMPESCFECALFSNCDSCEGYECCCGAIGAIGYIDSVPKDSRRADCPLVELPEQTIETNIFDECERHENCAVEVWKNSVTGATLFCLFDLVLCYQPLPDRRIMPMALT